MKKIAHEVLTKCNAENIGNLAENIGSVMGRMKNAVSHSLTKLGQKMHVVPTPFQSIKKQLGVVETLPSAPGTRKYLTRDHGIVDISVGDMGGSSVHRGKQWFNGGGISIHGENLPTSIIGIPNNKYEGIFSISRNRHAELYRSRLDQSKILGYADHSDWACNKSASMMVGGSHSERHLSPNAVQHFALKGLKI